MPLAVAVAAVAPGIGATAHAAGDDAVASSSGAAQVAVVDYRLRSSLFQQPLKALLML